MCLHPLPSPAWGGLTWACLPVSHLMSRHSPASVSAEFSSLYLCMCKLTLKNTKKAQDEERNAYYYYCSQRYVTADWPTLNETWEDSTNRSSHCYKKKSLKNTWCPAGTKSIGRNPSGTSVALLPLCRAEWIAYYCTSPPLPINSGRLGDMHPLPSICNL